MDQIYQPDVNLKDYLAMDTRHIEGLVEEIWDNSEEFLEQIFFKLNEPAWIMYASGEKIKHGERDNIPSEADIKTLSRKYKKIHYVIPYPLEVDQDLSFVGDLIEDPTTNQDFMFLDDD